MHAIKISLTSFVLAFSQSVTAQDNGKFEFHEEQWKNVAVHENRMISDESVSQWGAWTDVAPTAAGGGRGVVGPAISFAPPASPTVYRSVAEVTAPALAPAPAPAVVAAPVRVREPRPCRRRCE